MKKTLIKKRYTIEQIEWDNGTGTIRIRNDGFTVIELLGLISIAKDELLVLLRENTKSELENKNYRIDRKSKNSSIFNNEP